MESLKVIGQEKIGKFEFTGIEGGFGKDKKAMTINDIAVIHSTTVKRLNELIEIVNDLKMALILLIF